MKAEGKTLMRVNFYTVDQLYMSFTKYFVC